MTYTPGRLGRRILAGSLAAAALLSGQAYADDIAKGMRGPTNWQADERVVLSENDQNVKAKTNNLIMKYWDGDEAGKWAFLSLPYRVIDSPAGESSGFGDITAGIGPGGRMNDFHWLSYASLTFPTGGTSGGVKLGGGRYDAKIGVFTTYQRGKEFEIDGSLEHSFTGRDRQGVNPPEETAAGFVAGGNISGKIKVAGGLAGNVNWHGSYLLNGRLVFRYTASPFLHFEFIGDRNIREKYMLGNKIASFIVRYNF